jgi:hypothetical protein
MATLIEIATQLANTTMPDAEECRIAAEAAEICPIQLKTIFGHDLKSLPGDTPTQQLKTWILRAAALLEQQDGAHIPLIAQITKSSEEYVMKVISGIA